MLSWIWICRMLWTEFLFSSSKFVCWSFYPKCDSGLTMTAAPTQAQGRGCFRLSVKGWGCLSLSKAQGDLAEAECLWQDMLPPRAPSWQAAEEGRCSLKYLTVNERSRAELQGESLKAPPEPETQDSADLPTQSFLSGICSQKEKMELTDYM